MPEIYKIYTKLEAIKQEFNISNIFLIIIIIIINIYTNLLQTEIFTRAIDKGITKLQKYFPKTGINQSNKALYLSLILDPRIKKDGLEAIGLTYGQTIDIYNRLVTDYNI